MAISDQDLNRLHKLLEVKDKLHKYYAYYSPNCGEEEYDQRIKERNNFMKLLYEEIEKQISTLGEITDQ